jgi:hypothetical protein
MVMVMVEHVEDEGLGGWQVSWAAGLMLVADGHLCAGLVSWMTGQPVVA